MRPLRTLLVYSEIPDTIAHFAILEGDLRRFQGIFVNTVPANKVEADFQDALSNLVYDEDGNRKIQFSADPPTWEGACPFDCIVTCGFAC